MTNITIFTTCAPFTGTRGKIQEIAIQSWLNLIPQPEILIMGGREEGVKEFAREHDIQVIEDVEYKDYIINIYDLDPFNSDPKLMISPPSKVPKSNSMFNKAQEHAKHDTLCFTSSDIIHFQCLINGIKAIQQRFTGNYLGTGVRHDIDFTFEKEILNIPEILLEVMLYHGNRS